jgi:nicotinamidase-related amidase
MVSPMEKPKFPLSSEQLELLLLFEQHKGLTELSKAIGRDSSVVSRQLQKLASEFPVLSKEQGKWVLTPVGKAINEVSLRVIYEFENTLGIKRSQLHSLNKTALVVINAQEALLCSKFERSNPFAENNIRALLDFWRNNKGIVIHIKHTSFEESSLFHKNSKTVNFLNDLAPYDGEIVIEKLKSSAFTETELLKVLDRHKIEQIALVGFTANECIEATAKDAHEAGIESIVIGDATAMFDFLGQDRKIYKANKMHDLVLANIGSLYSVIEKTQNLLASR